MYIIYLYMGLNNEDRAVSYAWNAELAHYEMERVQKKYPGAYVYFKIWR